MLLMGLKLIGEPFHQVMFDLDDDNDNEPFDYAKVQSQVKSCLVNCCATWSLYAY